MHTNWEINGLSFYMDIEDLECAERYEAAFDKMQLDEEAVQKAEKASDRIRAYCRMYERLFDSLFGAGTAEKLFAGKPENISAYEEVYLHFLEFVRRQGAEKAKRRLESLAKYRPVRASRKASR